jgi:hypothetical protein
VNALFKTAISFYLYLSFQIKFLTTLHNSQGLHPLRAHLPSKIILKNKNAFVKYERDKGIINLTNPVQVLALQGGEIALDYALFYSAKPANQFRLSPTFYGSNPYPCSNLTYRGY